MEPEERAEEQQTEKDSPATAGSDAFITAYTALVKKHGFELVPRYSCTPIGWVSQYETIVAKDSIRLELGVQPTK